MDSSDSEDDFYGNMAKKLQNMKNKYTEDKIDTINLLDDSAELDELMRNTAKTVETAPKASTQKTQAGDVTVTDDSEDVLIDTLLARSSKRKTRSTAKKNSSNDNFPEVQPKKRTRRKTSNSSSNNSSVIEDANINTVECRGNNQSNHGKGSSRGRNRKSRRILPPTNYEHINSNSHNIPTYSIGNTSEYPDQSDGLNLFSTSTKCNDVVVIDENELDENEEMSVKVYWQSSEFFKFVIRRFQKLTQIFDYFARKESVSKDKLLFTFNDKILKPDDTPESIDYSIAKFIDGGIVNQSISKLLNIKNSKVQTNGIRVKFQCQNVKKPFETMVSLDEKLSIAMIKCAEYLETTIDKLKFEFDGDLITSKNTPNELNLQEDECIDVKIK